MNYLYNAVFFDFDGTLADTRQASIESTQNAFQHFGLVPPTPEQILHYMGIPIEKSFDAMRDNSLPEIETGDVIIFFREIYPTICDKSTYLYEGIFDLLVELKNEKFCLAVVTSKKSTVLARNMKNLGINSIFDVIIGSDHVSNYKPHPEPLNKAIDKLKSQTLQDVSGIMVGDAVSDIKMGKAARIHTCGVTWGAFGYDALAKSSPDHIVNSVNELRKCLLKEFTI